MEKFETYHFDGVFYTKEEIESMGLSLFGIDELKKLLNQQDQVLYQVTTYTSVSENTQDLQTYVDSFKEYKKVWAKVSPGNPCSILVIDFKFYYEIKHGDQVLLLSSESERNDTCRKIDRLVDNEIDKLVNQGQYVRDSSESYKSQEEQRKSKQKLLSIFTEEEGKRN